MNNEERKEIADMATMQADIKWIREKMENFDKVYVSKEAFAPVQRIVYGMAGCVLVAFLYALLSFTLSQTPVKAEENNPSITQSSQ